jgi:hypothetical protein
MIDLFKAECRRFAWWALGAGALHAALLQFLDRVVDTLQQTTTTYQLVAGVYAAVGLLLGLYQAGSYARGNHWIALLHRPLTPWRIGLAVTGGAGIALIAAVVLPLILLLASHGLIGGRFVDARHWLLPVAAALFALIGLLSGSLLVLSPRRYGWLIALIALLPTQSTASGWKALALQLAIAVVLALFVASAFKPDRERPPRGAALGGTALGVAIGAYWAMALAGDFVFQSLWILTGAHPLNSTPPPGGVVEAIRADGVDLMEAGLSGRDDPQHRLWREQVRMSQVFELPTARESLPERGELTNGEPIGFVDEQRGLGWTFSHDSMAFRGTRAAGGRPSASPPLTVAGGFAAPPLPVGEGRFIAGDSVFAFSPDDGAIHRRLRLPRGETVVAPPAAVGDAAAVLGDRALYFVDRRDLDGDGPKHPLIAVVPLPAPVGDLRRLHAVELLDGYLVSFTYGRNSIDGPAASWQRIVAVDGSGRRQIAGERELRPDFPAAARYSLYWLSPALNAVRAAAADLDSGSAAEGAHAPIEVPRGVWLAGALASLVAAAVAAWLARRRRLGGWSGAAWTGAALVAGLPALAAFWLIRPRGASR